MKKSMTNLKKKKGFTLIELIIVIAILGILAAIAVPNFTGVRDNARIKADATTAAAITNATNALLADGTIATQAAVIIVTPVKDDIPTLTAKVTAAGAAVDILTGTGTEAAALAKALGVVKVPQNLVGSHATWTITIVNGSVTTVVAS